MIINEDSILETIPKTHFIHVINFTGEEEVKRDGSNQNYLLRKVKTYDDIHETREG